MKTALISLFTALLLGSAAAAGDRLPDAADLLAILFTSGLVAWTTAQYRTIPRSLSATPRHHLPIKAVVTRSPGAVGIRQAA